VSLPGEVLVNAAPGAAKLALANILQNAVKFSPAGGLVRTVVTVPRRAVVAVSDTGPGVAPDELSRLFQRFYRGHAARSTDASGVGLGLAIARALVERQGGRIAVETARKREPRSASIYAAPDRLLDCSRCRRSTCWRTRSPGRRAG